MNELLSKIEKKLNRGEWYRVLFLGGSITSTEWVYPNWRGIMEYVLKEELEKQMGVWELPCWKVRFYNAGYNGARTKEMINFIDGDVALHRPNMIIFMDTYNDVYLDISPEEHERNLGIIFSKLTKIAEKVVFTNSISGFNKEINNENRAYIEVANRAVEKYSNKIKNIDLFSKYAKLNLKKFFTFIEISGNEDAGIKPGELDYSHPNQLGNAYIAKILLKEIFNIEFNAELYIKDTLAGKKKPTY